MAAAAGRTSASGVKARTPGPALQELDLQQLYSDPSYVPDRLIGPVEVQLPPGKTRRVVTKREVPLGTLLFVSEPIGTVARSDPGQALLPMHLIDHLRGQRLSEADRYKLAVLYDGTPASQQRQTSFKDFEFATATTKAWKSRAAAKGFGGGATGSKQPQGQQPAAGAAGAQQQQRVSVEMTQGRFESIVNYNAWGSEISDIGAAPARGEKFSSFVGIWPEFSLLNHSCIPNTTATLIGDRLVVRAASLLPKEAQLTTNYLDTKCGVPLSERRRALQVSYAFRCGCARCKLEEKLPEELQQKLESLHQLSLEGGVFDGLVAAADAKDAAALSAIAARATAEVEPFEAALGAAGLQAGTLDRAAVCAGAAAFFMALQRAKMLAASAAEASGGSDAGAAGGEGAPRVDPIDLFDLVELLRVYQPGGAAVLATAADALSYTAARHGPGSEQAKAALQLFLKMLMIKYGEVSDRKVLERLVDAITRSSARLAALGLDSGFALSVGAGGGAGGYGEA